MNRGINKNDIDQMLDNGYSIEEIAENQCDEECVQKVFEIESPSWCNENTSCYDCWVKCLEEYVEEENSKGEIDCESCTLTRKDACADCPTRWESEKED